MKPITKEQFQTLSMVEQAQYVLDSGEELTARIYMYYAIKLFVVNDFFVELWYHQTGNHIGKIRILEEDAVIGIYGDNIDISGALN